MNNLRYKAVLTHNPQDFFDGTEPHELCETVVFSRRNRKKIRRVLKAVDNGYKAIIFQSEGADNGREINVDQDRPKNP